MTDEERYRTFDMAYEAIANPKAICVYESPFVQGHWVVRFFHQEEEVSVEGVSGEVLWFTDAAEAHRVRDERSRAYDEKAHETWTCDCNNETLESG